MDVLTNITFEDIVQLTEEEFKTMLQALGLLHGSQTCDTCGNRMLPRGRAFICHRRACLVGTTKPIKGIYSGTFFNNSNLTPNKIFKLSYFWAKGYTMGNTKSILAELGISNEALVQWKQFFRDVCSEYYRRHPVRLGGPGIVVEVDETNMFKRKYNRGRALRGHWIFGAIERGTRNCILVPVPRRNRHTLFPIIQHYVLPGTMIHSDMWGGYVGLDTLPQGYGHQTVNHSENFVDPNTGAHTQTMESTWQKLKTMTTKSMYGLNNRRYIDYMYEFMWRQKFRDDTFRHFWQQVAEFYPCHP